MQAPTLPQHVWLQQLVGDWTWTSEIPAGADYPASTATGTETVRAIGELWIVGEGQGDMGGEFGHTRLTIGFDSKKQKFVGSWVGSMMDYQWVYEGEFEADGTAIGLCATGPSMTEPGQTALYKDLVTLHADGTRTLNGMYQQADGTWVTFMTTVYRRA